MDESSQKLLQALSMTQILKDNQVENSFIKSLATSLYEREE
jgi:hypothetical protein